MSPERKLLICKLDLQRNQPFFYYLLGFMNIQEMPANAKHQTMAVNQEGDLFYAKKFVDSLTPGQLTTALCHEVLHLAFKQIERGLNKEQDIWNIAIDLTVNTILKNEGFPMIRHIAVADDMDWYYSKSVLIKDVSTKTSETLYEELQQMSEEDKKDLFFDEHIPGKSSFDPDKNESEWKSRLVGASTFAKRAGNMSQKLDQVISEFLQEKVDWRVLVRRHLQRVLVSGNNWSKPNKKYLHQGIFMPAKKKENVKVFVYVDVSASVDQELVAELFTECRGLKRCHHNVEIVLIQWDTEVVSCETFTTLTSADNIEFNRKGCGGTDVRCVKKYLEDNNLKPNLSVFMTDGEFDRVYESELPKGHRAWLLPKPSTTDAIKYLNDTIIKLEK